MQKITSYQDLQVWQEGRKLSSLIYKVTEKFPSSEQFGITNQMRRAAVSVTSNIAEGFSRRSYADKKHFYAMSHGSLTEVQNQLIITRDIGFISGIDFKEAYDLTVQAHKLLTGLIKVTGEKT